MLIKFLYVLAIRFFLFEVNLFEPVRSRIRKGGRLLEKFLECSFCNGFWTALFFFWIVDGLSYYMVLDALVVGFVAFFIQLTMEFMGAFINRYADQTP